MSLLSSVIPSPGSFTSLIAIPTILKTPSKKQPAAPTFPTPMPIQVQMALGEGSGPTPPPPFPPTPSPTPSQKRKATAKGRLSIGRRWAYKNKDEIRAEGRKHSAFTYASNNGATLSLGSQQDILTMIDEMNATDERNYACSSASKQAEHRLTASGSEHSTPSDVISLQTPGGGSSQLALEGHRTRDKPFELAEEDKPRKRQKLNDNTKPPKCAGCGMPEFELHICELE
ncbi:hypothetical protein AAF712_015650 [Marasmius tenuissimus]|uniref:Uncharacterized protein n=1 Tax=Marasmius tenuissimus TaxID=585030 RepID=A0ABR2Z8W6_9AGAR